jgi:hypothetical protein
MMPWNVHVHLRAALDNLTSTQVRCNELLEENRALKARVAELTVRLENECLQNTDLEARERYMRFQIKTLLEMRSGPHSF